MDFPTIGDLRALPDPLLQYRWTMVIANVPGGGDGRRLQYQCKTASIPGLSAEKQTVTTHGVDLHYMGREQFGGTFPAQFFETRDLLVYKTFRNWINFARNAKKGTGNFKKDYATTCSLLLIDDTLAIIDTVSMSGFFPVEISESGLDGSSSAPVDFSVQFSFDYSSLSGE